MSAISLTKYLRFQSVSPSCASGELVVTGNTAELDDKRFTYYMTGRKFEKSSFVPQNISEAPVLEARNLTLNGSYEDVSFSLRRGEILGITGLLDSGRTELALSLFGIHTPSGGTLYKDGKPITLKTPQDAIRHRIGYVPEDRLSEGLFLPRSIADNVVVSEIDPPGQFFPCAAARHAAGRGRPLG